MDAVNLALEATLCQKDPAAEVLKAWGAKLCQEHEGTLQPVCYFSRKFRPMERWYSVCDREMLAIYATCMKWHCYL